LTITAAQIRAARQLTGVSQANLAEATGLSVPTIKRAESERDVVISSESIAAIRKALEKAGVEFIAENGGGAGVRLKKKGRGN
jgi:transcriptional regulator with XRE-family HTH domain